MGDKRIIDIWSISHLLAGSFFAGASLLMGLSFLLPFSLSAAIMIAWEYLEYVTKRETWLPNKIADIIIGLAGFSLTYYLLAGLTIMEKTFAFLIISIIFIIAGLLSLNEKKKKRKNNKNS